MADNYEQWKARTGQAGARGYDSYLKTEQQAAPAPAGPAPVAPAPTGGAPAPAPGGGGPAPAPAPQPSGQPPRPAGVPNSSGQDLSGFKSFADWQTANRAAGGRGLASAYEASGGTLQPGEGGGGGGGAPAPGGGGYNPNAFPPTNDPYQETGPTDALGNPNQGYQAEEGGAIAPFGQAAGPEAWRGKRAPTVQELRKWARAEHSAYLGGDKNAQDEDFERWNDEAVQAMIDDGTIDFNGSMNKGQGGGGGGGGGGRGGRGGAGGAGGAGGTSGSSLDASIEKNLQGLLDGSGTRYTPEVMQGLLAKIKQQMEGSKRRQIAEGNSDAAGRGVSRSGASLARTEDIRRGAEAGFTGEYADLLTKKVDADFQDRMGGLDRAQKYVDSLKLQLYRQDMTALQREQLRAQIQMATMNINAQRENLNTSIQGQKDLRGIDFGFDQLNQGAG